MHSSFGYIDHSVWPPFHRSAELKQNRSLTTLEKIVLPPFSKIFVIFEKWTKIWQIKKNEGSSYHAWLPIPGMRRRKDLQEDKPKKGGELSVLVGTVEQRGSTYQLLQSGILWHFSIHHLYFINEVYALLACLPQKLCAPHKPYADQLL
jgi:hypothetical protein